MVLRATLLFLYAFPTVLQLAPWHVEADEVLLRKEHFGSLRSEGHSTGYTFRTDSNHSKRFLSAHIQANTQLAVPIR
jgi:hypothetical protein